MENTTPVSENIVKNNTSSKKIFVIITTIVVIILIGILIYFLYQKDIINKKNIAEQEKQNQINQFYQKVYGSKSEMMPLTEEDYGLLLINPLINPSLDSKKTVTVNNVTVGLKNFAGSADIEVAFPYIPNLLGRGNVFVRLDSVKDSAGNEIFDASSTFEEDNDIFTKLSLEKKSVGNMPYLYGSRSLHLTRSVKSEYISEFKGRLVMLLPVNMQEIYLTTSDIGLKKPFAGGFVTLKEIKNNSIVVKLTEDIKDIYEYKGVDKENNIINSSGYSCSNDTCEIYIENVNGINLYYSKNILTKELPFTFNQIAETEPKEDVVKDENKIDVKNTDANPSVKTTTNIIPKINVSSNGTTVSAKEKEDIIKAYFDFKKILDSRDPNQMIQYSKKVYPSKIAEIDALYGTVPTQEEYGQMIEMIKSFFGYDTLLNPEKVRALDGSKWIRTSTNDVTLDIEVFVSCKFRKTNGIWYVHINDKF